MEAELVAYTILGYFEYACFKAAFYAHPEERDFVVVQYQNKNKEISRMEEFADLGSARAYYEAVVLDMIDRTSRSMVQDSLS